MSDPWRALIVGCGKIAGGYNRGPDDAMVLTHALAYRNHPGCKLAACVDSNAEVLADFAARWDVPRTYLSLDQALDSERFDIVSVCSPTGTHLATLRRLLQARPHAVFAEKPLDGDAKQAREIGAQFAAQEIPVAVNFTRRFDEAMHALRQSIREGRYGTLHSVVGWYGRGVVNTGSHLIDLVNYLTEREPTIEHVGAAQLCGLDPDFTVTAELDLGGVPFRIIGLPGVDVGRFEVEIGFSDAIVSLEDAGMTLRLRSYGASDVFANERALDRGTWQRTGYGIAMLRAIDELLAWRSGARLSSDIESAAFSIELADEIRARSVEKSQ